METDSENTVTIYAEVIVYLCVSIRENMNTIWAGLSQSMLVPQSTKPIAGVVFLHGLGDTSAGWAETCAQMSRLQPTLANVKA